MNNNKLEDLTDQLTDLAERIEDEDTRDELHRIAADLEGIIDGIEDEVPEDLASEMFTQRLAEAVARPR